MSFQGHLELRNPQSAFISYKVDNTSIGPNQFKLLCLFLGLHLNLVFNP